MMVDWGSRDDRFNRLPASANIAGDHQRRRQPSRVPLKERNLAVEAAIGTLVPRDGKVLVLISGATANAWRICQSSAVPSAPETAETNRPPPTSTVCFRPTPASPRRADSLRNQYRHPQPAAGDRPRLRNTANA
jgi:2-aminoethylphosphonate-pyruvate transaminase